MRPSQSAWYVSATMGCGLALLAGIASTAAAQAGRDSTRRQARPSGTASERIQVRKDRAALVDTTAPAAVTTVMSPVPKTDTATMEAVAARPAASTSGSAVAGSSAAAIQPVPPLRRGRLTLQPYVGYVNFGEWFETNSGAEFTADNAVMVGAAAGIRLNRAVSLLGNIGYAPTKFLLADVPVRGGGTSRVDLSGDVGFWVYDVDLQLRAPLAEDRVVGFSPFAQVGVGGARYTADYNDLNARNRASDVAFNFAVGGDLQLSRLVGLRVMAKDYITSFEWDQPGDVTPGILGARTAHNWALTVGLNIGFGR